MAEEMVWVRFLDSTLRFRSRNGRLDADAICKKWKLDPESLIIGPDAIAVGDDGLSRATVVEIRQAASEVGGGDGKSRNTPFLLEASRETSVPRLLNKVEGEQLQLAHQREIVISHGERKLRIKKPPRSTSEVILAVKQALGVGDGSLYDSDGGLVLDPQLEALTYLRVLRRLFQFKLLQQLRHL